MPLSGTKKIKDGASAIRVSPAGNVSAIANAFEFPTSRAKSQKMYDLVEEMCETGSKVFQ